MKLARSAAAFSALFLSSSAFRPRDDVEVEATSSSSSPAFAASDPPPFLLPPSSSSRSLEDASSYSARWIADRSIKFQGCHQIYQWNSNAEGGGGGGGDEEGDGEDEKNGSNDAYDVKLRLQRFVRYRLCPSNKCNGRNVDGCKNGYGEYVVDLNSYASYRAKERYMECGAYYDENCDCDDGEGGGDGDGEDGEGGERREEEDRDECAAECYSNGGMDDCVDNDPYADGKERFVLAKYASCARWGADDEEEERESGDEGGGSGDGEEEGEGEGGEGEDGGERKKRRRGRRARKRIGGRRRRRRRLEGEGEEGEESGDGESGGSDDGDAYYVGPYCAEQGGGIYMGVFLDDSCTEFADDDNGRYTYEDLTGGESLPYGEESLVGRECASCVEPSWYGYGDDGDGNDDDDEEDRPSQQCEGIYASSGKCETNVPNDVLSSDDKNEAACAYLAGVKSANDDGIVSAGDPKPNGVATFFCVVFGLTFAVLAGYVYFIRKKLGRKITLMH